MEKNGIKRLVVLEEDGSCAGVLSTTDIARKLGKDTCRRLQPICSHESGVGSLKALQRMTARIGRHYHATPPLAKFASVRAYCSPTPLTHAETRKYE
jgi:hypothetical protein